MLSPLGCANLHRRGLEKSRGRQAGTTSVVSPKLAANVISRTGYQHLVAEIPRHSLPPAQECCLGTPQTPQSRRVGIGIPGECEGLCPSRTFRGRVGGMYRDLCDQGLVRRHTVWV